MYVEVQNALVLLVRQLVVGVFFFVSSRRRHTSLTCDWSSDVCSSDLTETDSGDRALERALEGSFSCVVLDVMLPGRDGFSVVGELRKRGVSTPVLLLTAKDELESRVRGLEGGADDYVAKPFDLPELLARVHA